MTIPSITEYRALLASALAHADGTYTVDDVEAEVEAGTAQFWPGPRSCIVTQIDRAPQRSVLHFFVAAGKMQELEAMTPEILQWGREQGCTLARMVGRKGWERSFLVDTGWSVAPHITMEKNL